MTLRNDLSSVIQKITSEGYVINHVFDIGANKGNWTAHYEKQMPNADFFLFEANSKQGRPSKLAQTHKWFNAVLSNEETTEVEFYSVTGTGDSYYKEQTKAYDSVSPLILQTITLDEMVRKHSLPFPQIMKLDTQGSELDILNGAKEVVANTDIIVTEISMLPYNLGAPTFDAYMKFLSDLGYVPMGIEGINFIDNMLGQVDIVFMKKDIKVKYYGDSGFFRN